MIAATSVANAGNPEAVDLLVRADHFLTMEGDGVGYRGGTAMAVREGKIIDIGPKVDLAERYRARQSLDFGRNLVMPGFVDAHVHLKLALLRGLAQDVSNWMMDGLSPFSSVAPTDPTGLAVKLGLLEAVRAGTTTFSEFSGGLDIVGDVFSSVGVRGVLTAFIREAAYRRYRPGELYDYIPDLGRRSLSDAIGTYDRWNGAAGGRLAVYFGPQGADFASRELLLKTKDEAATRGVKIHMHVQQGDRETAQTMMRYSLRPIPWLSKIGYLDDQLIAVHLTDADESEAEAVARSGSSMVLCSGSIGIIDGIVPPAVAFQSAGGSVGLGSDQAPGNNCHNMWNEMKLTALFNKIRYTDPEVMPAWKVLRMATVEGARSLGIGDVTGSLEIGKRADFIVVDLERPTMQPVHLAPMRNLVPNLVYSARGDEVTTVVVDGLVVMENGTVTGIDEQALYSEIRVWSENLGVTAAGGFSKGDGPNQRFMREGKL
jgi:5-methylthioadenosine/S-adenosylhomocysteine deaminase